MTNQQKIIKTKVGILELARQLGNVSRACKVTEGIVLTESQLAAMERVREEKEAHAARLKPSILGISGRRTRTTWATSRAWGPHLPADP